MATRPNVLLFIVDQMRGDAWGGDGSDTVLTPNLDHLASKGTRFCHAYSAVPSCIPARATLWTGMDQWHTGILGMGGGQCKMHNDYPYTLPGMLSDAGYRTHMVGKGHFHPYRSHMGFNSIELEESGRHDDSMKINDYRQWFYANAPEGVTPDDHGVFWNAWQGRPWHTHEHLHPTAWTAMRAINFLKNRDPDQPFFLNVSFSRPHSPYVPPQAYWDMYINEDLPPAQVGDWAAMHDDSQTRLDINAWRGRMTPRQIHRARAGYFGEISFIDARIGNIINYLRLNQPSALDNTWIIFMSDHGDMQGDHNLWRKTYAYEGSARIPLFVVPPLDMQGKTRSCAEQVVELRDIMPTVLEAAGLEAPPTTRGKSLMPLLADADTPWREYIHGEHCWCYGPDQEMQYVTDGARKFIWLPRIGVQQFFDLQADPHELHNLIDSPERADEIALWRQRLITELRNRQCGWCDDGQLSCQEQYLTSPWRNERWDGSQ